MKRKTNSAKLLNGEIVPRANTGITSRLRKATNTSVRKTMPTRGRNTFLMIAATLRLHIVYQLAIACPTDFTLYAFSVICFLKEGRYKGRVA